MIHDTKNKQTIHSRVDSTNIETDRVQVDASSSMDFSFLIGLSEALKEKKISFKQYFLLGRIAESGPMLMKEIAELLCVEAAAVTGMIDHLGKDKIRGVTGLGYVQRIPSIDDRRRIEVHITPEGVRIVSEIRKVTQDLIAALLQARDEGRDTDSRVIESELGSLIDAR